MKPFPKPTWLKAAFVGLIAFFVTLIINSIMTYLLNGRVIGSVVLISSTFVGTLFAVFWKWKMGQLYLLKQAVEK